MKATEFATHVRYMTRTSSTTFTDAQIIALMKIRQDEIARAILKADEDILLIPQEADLVEDQREYAFPTDMIANMSRASAQFNGTDWIPLEEIDIKQINFPVVTEANIVARFNSLQASKSNPYGARFDIRRKSLYLYSGAISDVTDGLKVYVSTYPGPITDLSGTTDMSVDPSTTTHGIPRALHEAWARGVTIDYKESREKPIPLSETELNYKDDLDKSIETLRHGNLDRQVIGELPSSSELWADGFNL